MTQHNRVDILDDSDCHFLPIDPKDYLFSSPTEICHWNSSVCSLSSPESEDSLDLSSQSADSSLGYSDSLSSYSMEPSTYRNSTSRTSQWSPEATSENMPETDFYHTGVWRDQMPGNAPFSPVLSDFTLPTSETSFLSLGHASTQEMGMVGQYDPANWSAEFADRSYIDESAVSEQSLFPFPDQVQPEVMQAEYRSWFTPSEVNFDHYFQMDPPQGSMSGFAPVAPQTAGFVGSTPIVPSSHPGSYQTVGSTAGQFDSVNAPHLKAEPALHHAQTAMPAVLPSGPYASAGQSPQLTQARAPRRLSVAVHPPVNWTQEAEQKPLRVVTGQEYGNLAPQYNRSVAIPRAHRSSNASMVGSTCSGLSSAASSVGPVKIERSLSAASQMSTRARSEDSEGKPRSHKYYTTARPQADGNYHCPYLHLGNCSHKPTKLKCNYDKYIDSHLRPFICRQEECKGQENENRFSSTACLLRHEREAHGLHGHGNKPYTCHYEGCERAQPGNGFPRNYNLMDHMKRVHRYKPEEKSPSTPGSSNGKRGPKSDTHKVKKRKAPEGPKRTLTGSSNSSSRRQAGSPGPALSRQYSHHMADFNACSDKLQQHLQRFENPREAATAASHLREISQRYG